MSERRIVSIKQAGYAFCREEGKSPNFPNTQGIYDVGPGDMADSLCLSDLIAECHAAKTGRW